MLRGDSRSSAMIAIECFFLDGTERHVSGGDGGSCCWMMRSIGLSLFRMLVSSFALISFGLFV